MKSLLLAALPLLLVACASQPTPPLEPEVADNAAGRCVTNCEYAHQGQIRACILQPVTMGRSGTQFNGCIGDAYQTLGVCYQGCTTDPEE